MARLDRLGPAKEVAQIGAAIGREFSHAILSAVCQQAGSGTASGPRPSDCRWLVVPARCASACQLSVQARTGAGRGLWHFVARAETRLHSHIAIAATSSGFPVRSPTDQITRCSSERARLQGTMVRGRSKGPRGSAASVLERIVP